MDNANQDDLRRLARAWFAEVRENRIHGDSEFDAWLKLHRRKERRQWLWRRSGRWSVSASNDNNAWVGSA